MYDFDMVIIGSGPSGRRAAIQAAKLGRSVLVVEKGRRVGGVSVHTGTIPSKTLRETVLNLSGWRERGFYGRAYRVKQNIEASDLMARMHKTLDHEVEVLEHQFARNGVKTARGAARFVDPHRIEVLPEGGDPHVYSAAHILIACGTKPFRPDYVPFNGVTVLDSDEIVDLKTLPRSMAVIGAGVIGVEYATIFSALDVAVTLIEPRPTFLDFVDRELIEEFSHDLRDRNVALRLGSPVASIKLNEAGRTTTTLKNGRVVQADMLLFAAGRVGATDGLNLQAAGLGVDKRGRLAVTPETLQTAVPHIYAAGDVIGFPSLASTSMEQGRLAACHAFGDAAATRPRPFPTASIPCRRSPPSAWRRRRCAPRTSPTSAGSPGSARPRAATSWGCDSGMMKLIFSTETRRLLGAHIVGEGATELIHIGQAVLNLKGTIDYFIENTFNYPTLAEAYKIAGLDAWNRMAQR